MPTGRATVAGWKVESKYSPGVLMGNWQEERMTNEKKIRPMTTYKISDVRQPGVLIRNNANLVTMGLPASIISGHCVMRRKDEDLITWYDEDYNRRPREAANKPPALRTWSSRTMSWVPERSDYPLQGAPTNYGLHASKKEQWKEQLSRGFPTRRDTTYTLSYFHWFPKDYVNIRHSTVDRLPVLSDHKPVIQSIHGPAAVISKPRCSYLKTVSLRPRALSAAVPAQLECNPAANGTAEQLAELPIAAL